MYSSDISGVDLIPAMASQTPVTEEASTLLASENGGSEGIASILFRFF